MFPYRVTVGAPRIGTRPSGDQCSGDAMAPVDILSLDILSWDIAPLVVAPFFAAAVWIMAPLPRNRHPAGPSNLEGYSLPPLVIGPSLP